MISLQINDQKIEVPEGTMLIHAAKKVGVEVPTMCYLDGYSHFTSCMVCMVQDKNTGMMLPACSQPVAEGMVIETDNPEVNDNRKETLELLMSDHVGDCVAPCQRTCPAHMNIPLMNQYIEVGKYHEALVTVKQRIALPAVLGRICPAPCENNCRRTQVDRTISICSLKCFVADDDLKSETPWLPDCKNPTGKKVAIIGSGPTGLSAAYYLQQDGHACFIYDNNEKPGGMLRYGVSEKILPHDVLDAEINTIRKLGAEFIMNTAIGTDISFAEIREQHDAVILATGQLTPELLKKLGVKATTKSVKIDNSTFQTSEDGIFAGGNVVTPGKLAIRSVGHGKTISECVHKYLNNKLEKKPLNRALSKVGKIKIHELDEYAQGIEDLKDDVYNEEFHRPLLEGNIPGIPESEAKGEASKCMQCGCASFYVCKLRIYSERYQINSQRFKPEVRRDVERVLDHPMVVYEPGKCIQCGLCVRITEEDGEDIGLTFVGRGFEVKIDPPLNKTMDQGMEKTAIRCIDACPSGALAYKNKMCGCK